MLAVIHYIQSSRTVDGFNMVGALKLFFCLNRRMNVCPAYFFLKNIKLGLLPIAPHNLFPCLVLLLNGSLGLLFQGKTDIISNICIIAQLGDSNCNFLMHCEIIVSKARL